MSKALALDLIMQMCSVSIQCVDETVCITMNRDELRERAPETPPSRWSSGLIAPRDAASQGTWIGVAPNGIWACLLNSYEPVIQSAYRPSRGLLVPRVLAAQDDPEQLLRFVDLQKYLPFRLIIGIKWNLTLYHWDGKELGKQVITILPYFISSSSWRPEKVLVEREIAFRTWQGANMPHDLAGRPLLHLWQEPDAPESGIFMRRVEAYTTSITQIRLRNGRSPEMGYWPSDNISPVGRDAFFH
jgi:hypothetical protein